MTWFYFAIAAALVAGIATNAYQIAAFGFASPIACVVSAVLAALAVWFVALLISPNQERKG